MRDRAQIVTRRSATRRAAMVVWCVWAVVGCARAVPPRPAEDSLDAWRAHADAIEAQRDAFTHTSGRWRGQASASEVHAFYRGADLFMVQETMDLGEWGRRELRYVFAGGRLRYASERASVRVSGAAGGTKMVPLERQLLFDEAGLLKVASQRLDGVAGEVEPGAASGLREHADELIAVAPPPAGE